MKTVCSLAFLALSLTASCATAQSRVTPPAAASPALLSSGPMSGPMPAPMPAPFSLPELPYGFAALEPAIDEATMRLHHGRHHGAQVAALNGAVAADPALAGLGLEALLARSSQVSPAVRNNAGGHWNHSFYWQIMAPVGAGGAPSPALAAAIARDFGSMEAFKAQFRAAQMGRFGSGWAWVIVRADGRLAIGSTPNQDNPLMDVGDLRGQPILGNDVWEHAYYLKYQNRRADYVDAWWSVVNWNRVSALYASAIAGAPPSLQPLAARP